MSMDQNWYILIFIFSALFWKEIERGRKYNTWHTTWLIRLFLNRIEFFFPGLNKNLVMPLSGKYQKGFYLLNELREKKFESKEFVCFLISRSNFSLDSINLNTFDLDFIAKNTYAFNSKSSSSSYSFNFFSLYIQNLFDSTTIHYSQYHVMVVWMNVSSHSLFSGHWTSLSEAVVPICRVAEYGVNLFITKIGTSKFIEQWTFDCTLAHPMTGSMS